MHAFPYINAKEKVSIYNNSTEYKIYKKEYS